MEGADAIAFTPSDNVPPPPATLALAFATNAHTLLTTITLPAATAGLAGPHAVVVLDANARLRHGTPSAHTLLARADGLCVRAHCLQAWQPADGTVLRDRIAAASAPRPAAHPPFTALRIQRPSGARPYELLILPLPHDSAAACALIIRDPAAIPAYASALLAALYGLTPSERRLALALVSGATLAQAAAGARVKPETTRTHLKALYTKTATTRQHELVACLAGSLSLLPPFWGA